MISNPIVIKALVGSFLACCIALLAIFCADNLKHVKYLWFWIAVAVLVPFAGAKHGGDSHVWTFTFQNGVRDYNSYCSNDTIHAEWIYYEAYRNYAFRWCYRDLTFTNEVGVCIDEYHYLPDAMVSDSIAEANVPNATNMQVVCYALYVPPVYVVTNGVYHIGGVMRSMSSSDDQKNDFVTPGIIIKADLSGNPLTPTNKPPEI